MEELFKKLLRDLSSLPEDAMRLDLLKRRFAELAPRELAELLSLAYSSGAQGGAGAPGGRRKGIEHIKSALFDPASLPKIMDKAKRVETYAASLEMGLMNVSRLFTDLSPRRTGIAGYDKEEEVKMEHISLGERRSLSKVSSKEKLLRLLSDPDPMVIRNLLNNPRIVEKDVLKIASKRPNSPRILGVIARHAKWSRNYNVKKALAMNPYAPPRLAIGVIDSLLKQDVACIASDMTLHAQVRAAARDMIEAEINI